MCRTGAGAVFASLLYASAALAADDLRRFEDFCRVNGRVRYIAVARFCSDIDNRYLMTATRRAIDSGLTEGLRRSGDTTDFSAIRGSLETAFVDESITTLAVYKIVNNRLQFDLYDLPVLDDPDHFGPELASNRLIRLNDTGGLQAALAHARAPVSMPALHETFNLITETAPIPQPAPVPTLCHHGSTRTMEVQRLSIRLPSGAPALSDCQVTGYSVLAGTRLRWLQRQFPQFADYLELQRFVYAE